MSFIPIQAKNYGFVIDNRKCIGCHACSVACEEADAGVRRVGELDAQFG